MSIQLRKKNREARWRHIQEKQKYCEGELRFLNRVIRSYRATTDPEREVSLSKFYFQSQCLKFIFRWFYARFVEAEKLFVVGWLGRWVKAGTSHPTENWDEFARSNKFQEDIESTCTIRIYPWSTILASKVWLSLGEFQAWYVFSNSIQMSDC